eukprot:scaffold18009_cov20-Tisochrysis_lutea.AAC.5
MLHFQSEEGQQDSKDKKVPLPAPLANTPGWHCKRKRRNDKSIFEQLAFQGVQKGIQGLTSACPTPPGLCCRHWSCKKDQTVLCTSWTRLLALVMQRGPNGSLHVLDQAVSKQRGPNGYQHVRPFLDHAVSTHAGAKA